MGTIKSVETAIQWLKVGFWICHCWIKTSHFLIFLICMFIVNLFLRPNLFKSNSLQTWKKCHKQSNWKKAWRLSFKTFIPRIKLNNNFYQKKKEICLQNLQTLNKHNIINLENNLLSSTEKGQSMAKFYIKFETMVEISQISPNSTIEDLVYFFFLLFLFFLNSNLTMNTFSLI